MHADSDERSGSYTGHLRVPGEVGGGEPDDGKLSSPVRGEARGVPAMDASAPTLLAVALFALLTIAKERYRKGPAAASTSFKPYACERSKEGVF